jgi:hypothetical protein
MMAPWTELLAQAIATHGQAEVARLLGLSPSTISMVSRGEYPAATDNIEAKVLLTFSGDQVPPIPVGYLRNARGHLVPLSDVTPLELQADTLARDIESRARALSQMMADTKQSWLTELAAHVQLAADQYQADITGRSGTVAIQSFDGAIRVERQYSRALVVNERVSIAKELVDRYVRAQSDKMDPEQKSLIIAATRVDDQGNYSASALLSLARRIKSSSPDWQKAVSAINDSVSTVYGDPYVRVYLRGQDDSYKQIPLDFPAV